MDVDTELIESLTVATQLAQTLGNQGENIEASCRQTTTTHHNTTTALTTARRMDSLRYRTWYWLRDTVTGLLEPFLGSITPEPPPSKVPVVSTVSTVQGDTQQLLSQLTNISLEIGHELDHHNQVLDKITDQTGNSTHQLREIKRRGKAILH